MNGRALVRSAAAGFGSNLAALAREANVPLRTLQAIQSGQSRGAAGIRMLLAILAEHPTRARQMCQNACRAWWTRPDISDKDRTLSASGQTSSPLDRTDSPYGGHI